MGWSLTSLFSTNTVISETTEAYRILCLMVCSVVLTQYQRVSDRETDEIAKRAA